MNVLSLLHCVVSRVSHGQISGQMSMSGWVYFRRSLFVRGCGLTCAGDVVKDGALLC